MCLVRRWRCARFVAAVLAVERLSLPDIHGRGPGRVFLDRDVRQSLLLAFACSAVVTFGFALTPNRDADILITFRVGSDLQWLACAPPSDSFGRLRFLNRDLGGSYAAMRSGVRGDTANPMLLFLALFLLTASVAILGQCVGELLAQVNRYGAIALAVSACIAWVGASMAVEQNRRRCQSDDMETARGAAGTLVSDVA